MNDKVFGQTYGARFSITLI